MAATLEAQSREWRVEKESELWETADTVREMRKAIRATRFWPSEEMRSLRRVYEAQKEKLSDIPVCSELAPSFPGH